MLILLQATTISAYAQSKLLENVKRNPSESIQLCKRFKELNDNGISSGSKRVIKEIALERNLSEMDAEILSVYVIALHCPQVK